MPRFNKFQIGNMTLGERRAFVQRTGHSIEALADETLDGTTREDLLHALVMMAGTREDPNFTEADADMVTMDDIAAMLGTDAPKVEPSG